jgi:hypothetical protein
MVHRLGDKMARASQVKTIRITNNSGTALTGQAVELKRDLLTYGLSELGNGYYKIDSIPVGQYSVYVGAVDTGQTIAVGAGEVDKPDYENSPNSFMSTDGNGLPNWTTNISGDGSGLTNVPMTGEIKVSVNDTTLGYLEDKIVVPSSNSGIVRSILNEGANEQVQVELGPHFKALASTGLYEGGTLSIGATTGTFDIAEGEGFYIDAVTDWRNVSFNPVIISARTNIAVTNIATQPVTYVCLDKDDNVIQLSNYPTPDQYRQYIFLGVVVHSDNVNVNAINNEVLPSINVASQVFDHMNSVGFMNVEGNVISANGPNLSIDKSAGIVFKTGANYHIDPNDPHRPVLPVLVAPSNMRYRLSDSTEYTDTAFIDPNQYESSPGVLSPVNNNDWSIQRVYIFPSNIIRLMYGQEQYASRSKVINAIGTEPFTVETNIKENGLLIGLLAIRQGATDLSNSSDAIFYAPSKFGEVGSQGSTSVGDLQDAYLNSITPEITTTNGSVDIKAGVLDTDKVLTIQNTSGGEVFGVTGEGDLDVTGSVTAENFQNTSSNASANIMYRQNSLSPALWVVNNLAGGIQKWSNNISDVPLGEVASIAFDGSFTTEGSGTFSGDLDVTGSGTFGGEVLLDNTNLLIDAPTASGTKGLLLYRGGAERGRFAFDYSQSRAQIQADGDIKFYTNGELERMTIKNDGDVALDNNLEVTGSVFTDTIEASEPNHVISYDTANDRWQVQNELFCSGNFTCSYLNTGSIQASSFISTDDVVWMKNSITSASAPNNSFFRDSGRSDKLSYKGISGTITTIEA